MHEIDNLNINLEDYSVDSAIVSYFKNDFPKQLDEVLSELFPANKYYVIKEISIEINVEYFIDLNNSEKKRFLRKLIRDKIKDNRDISLKEDSNLTLLLFYLKNGYHKFNGINERTLVSDTISKFLTLLLEKINNETKNEVLVDALIKLIDKYNLYAKITLVKKGNKFIDELFNESKIHLKESTKKKILKIVFEYINSNKDGTTKTFKKYLASQLNRISLNDLTETSKISALLGKSLDSDELTFRSILQSNDIESYLDLNRSFDYDKFIKWLSTQKLLEQLDSAAIRSIIQILGEKRFINLIYDLKDDKLTSNISLFIKWVFSFSAVSINELEGLLVAYFKTISNALSNKELVEDYFKFVQYKDQKAFNRLSTYYIKSLREYSIPSTLNYKEVKALDTYAINWIAKTTKNDSIALINALLFYVDYGIETFKNVSFPLNDDTWKYLRNELTKRNYEIITSQNKLSRLLKIISAKEFFSYVKSFWARLKHPSLLLFEKIAEILPSLNENIAYGVNYFLVESTERIYKLANDAEVERLYKEFSTLWLGSFSVDKKDVDNNLVEVEKVITTIYLLIDEWDVGNKPHIETTTENAFILTLQSEGQEVVRYIKTKKQPIIVLTQLLNQFGFSTSYHIIQQFFKDDKGFKLLVEQTDMLPTEEMRMAVIQNILTVREAKTKSISKDNFEVDDSSKTQLASYGSVYTAFNVWLNYYLLTNKTLYNKSKLEELLISLDGELLTDTIDRLSKKDRNNVLTWLTHHLRFEIVEKLISSVFGYKHTVNQWRSFVKRTKSIDKKIKLTKLYISNDGEALSDDINSLIPKEDLTELFESPDNFSLLLTYLRHGLWTSFIASLEDVIQDVIATRFNDLIAFIINHEEKNVIVLRILFNFKEEYFVKILHAVYEDLQLVSLISASHDEKLSDTIWKYKLALDLHNQDIQIADIALLNSLYDLVKEDSRFKYSVNSVAVLQIVQELFVYDKLRLDEQLQLLHSITKSEQKKEFVYEFLVLSYTRFSFLIQLNDERFKYLKALYFNITPIYRQKLWVEWLYSSSNMPVELKRILMMVVHEEISFEDIEPSLFFIIDVENTFFSKSIIDKSIAAVKSLPIIDLEVGSKVNNNSKNFSFVIEILTQKLNNKQLIKLKKYKKFELVNIVNELIQFLSKDNYVSLQETESIRLSKNGLISIITDINKSKLSLYQIHRFIVNDYFKQKYEEEIDQFKSSSDYYALYNKFIATRDLNVIVYLSDYKPKFISWLEEESLVLTFYSILEEVIGEINAFEWLYAFLNVENKSILERRLFEDEANFKTLDLINNQDTENETTNLSTTEVESDILSDLYTVNNFLNYLILNFENNTLNEVNVNKALKQLTTNPTLIYTKSLASINWTGKSTFLSYIFDRLTYNTFLLVLSYIFPNVFRFIALYENTWHSYFTNNSSTKINRKFFVNSVIDVFVNGQAKFNDETIFYKIVKKYILINDIDVNSLYHLLPTKLRKQLSDSNSSVSALVNSANYSEYDKFNAELISILQVPDSIDIEATDITFLSLANITEYAKHKRLELLWDDINKLQSEIDLLTSWVQTFPINTSFSLIQNWLKLNQKAVIKKKLGELYPEKWKHIFNERQNLALFLNNSLLLFYDVVAIYFLLAFKNQFNTEKNLQNYLSHLSVAQLSEVSQLVQTQKNSYLENEFLIKLEDELKAFSVSFSDDIVTVEPNSSVVNKKELEISDLANISDEVFKQKLPILVDRLTELVLKIPKNQKVKEELQFLWETINNRLSNIEELLVALKADKSFEHWALIQLRLSENQLLEPILILFERRFAALKKANELAKEWLSRYELELPKSQIELRLWSLISFHFDKNYPLAQLLKDFVKMLPLQYSVPLFQQLKEEEKEKEERVKSDEISAQSDDRQPLVDHDEIDEVRAVEREIRDQLQDQLIVNRKEEAVFSLSVINPKLYRIDQDIIREQFFDYISLGHFKNITAKPVGTFSTWLKNLDRLLNEELTPIRKRIAKLTLHTTFVENLINRTNSLFKLWLLEWFIPFLINNKVVSENLNMVQPVIEKYRPNWNYETIVDEYMRSYMTDFIHKESFTLSEWTKHVLGTNEALSVEDIAKLDKHTTASVNLNEELSIIEKLDRKELVIEDEPLEGLIHLPYAGIVILGPYLSRLFDLLGYLKEDKKSFLNVEKACRAVYALAFLNGKDEAMNEPEYLIHKILCGLPLALPLPPMPELLESERNTMLSMLNGVKNNWPKMQRSSIEAMQQSFLNREGSLSFHENYWQVQIEKQTMDILMQSIPWSFAKIKLSWMEHPINVEWT